MVAVSPLECKMNSSDLKSGVNKILVHFSQNPIYHSYSLEVFLCWVNAFKLSLHWTDCHSFLHDVYIHRSDWFFQKM